MPTCKHQYRNNKDYYGGLWSQWDEDRNCVDVKVRAFVEKHENCHDVWLREMAQTVISNNHIELHLEAVADEDDPTGSGYKATREFRKCFSHNSLAEDYTLKVQVHFESKIVPITSDQDPDSINQDLCG